MTDRSGHRPAPLLEPRAGTTTRVDHDVLAVPGHYCLYDAGGERIDGTVTWTAGRRRGPAPERIEVPRDPVTIEAPVVFGGLLPKAHFGHVLLEMFTRLWVYDAGEVAPDTPLVHFTHYQRPLERFEQRLLEAALGAHRPPRVPVDRPLLLQRAITPDQAIILGQPMLPAVLPIYDRIRHALAGPTRLDPRPLYLSRSRLPDGRRHTLGERALEERLARRGVRIVHPQELPLEEQIRLVGDAPTVVGLSGSALHLTVLRDLPDARTISLDPRTPFAVQRDVDALRGSRFVHVHAQYPVHPRLPSGRVLDIGPYRNLVIPGRLDRTLAALL